MATSSEETKRSLSTFSGVFTPSILTILGVILYLRLGWVVGSVGLLQALLIVVLASGITFITGMSISSIATNMEVKTGGAYYMVSRSLGSTLGGSIGIPLYFSQALSIPLYIIGFVESLKIVYPGISVSLLAIITVIVVTLLTFIGAKFVIRVQYFILAAIILSLVSYFGGAFQVAESYSPILWLKTSSYGFWKVFAVYFPAVTGILAGVSMSGDLQKPQIAIPKGTLAAIIVGFIVYFFVAITLAFSASMSDLAGKQMIMTMIARWPMFVLLGIWGATLSSAFGSILGAPRTLQALARDNIIDKRIGRGFGKQDEPLIALSLTFIIAMVAVIFGSIDTIAPILTMFFLATYGVLNFVSALETLVKNPQFRPQFKTPWWVSMLGAIACFLTMFVINTLFTMIAVIVIMTIYFSLKRRNIQQTWGDISKGIWLSIANFCLQKLKTIKNDPKNWRPYILVFSYQDNQQKELVKIAHWFVQENGIVMACHLIKGKLQKKVREIMHTEKKSEQYIKEQELNAFATTAVIHDLEQDTAVIAQTAGIGDVKPNTILFHWEKMSWLNQKHFIGMIRNQFYIGKNTVIYNANPREAFDYNNQIDIWWGGQDRNIELMLMLAYLLKLNKAWQKAQINVKSIVESERQKNKTAKEIKEFLFNARINAEIEVIQKQKTTTISEMIRASSKNAEVVFLGLAYPETGKEREYYQRMELLAEAFNIVLFVRNSKRSGTDLV